MPTPTHEVYRVLLKIGGVDWRWTFRIYDDDSLQIDNDLAGDTPTPQAMTHAFNQHLDFTYVTIANTFNKNAPVPGMHSCSLFLVQRQEESTHVSYAPIVRVTCILSREFGFEGQTVEWLRPPGTLAGVYQALCPPVACSVAEEPVRATLYPLTVGYYTLKGVVMCEGIGSFSAIILEVQLLPGGQVAGTGFESAFSRTPRTTPLTGTWSPKSLEIFHVFAISPLEDPYQFRLRGRVTQYTYISRWTYAHVSPFQREGEVVATAELRVAAMRRYWSPEVHRLFPQPFKQAVRWCLLSSLRHRSLEDLWLPSVLWPRVFQFCDSSWFS